MIRIFTVYQRKGTQFPVIRVIQEVQYIDDFIHNADGAVKLLETLFNITHYAEEYVYVLSMSSSNKVHGVSELSHGGVTSTMFPRNTLATRLLLSGASKCIIVHNHPSGSLVPSKQDLKMHENVKDLCNLIDVTFADNLIVSLKGYYSILHDNLR